MGIYKSINTDNSNNTKSAFNNIAASYDNRDNQNPILHWMRGLVHKVYLEYMPKGGNILELNAGTGTDAVFLADNGYKVHATDISDEMIDVLSSNAKIQMSNGMIKCEVKSFEDISSVLENNFDAVVSNFGGLNCINDFSKLSGDISAKLKPNGLFIAVVMNKFCPWEIFYYIVTFKFGEAFRRFNKKGIMARLNGEKVLTYYFAPNKFSKAFGNNFKKVKIYSLGNYTPPPYLVGIFNKLKPLVKLWMKFDELTMGLPVFNQFGDHFIIVMKKK